MTPAEKNFSLRWVRQLRNISYKYNSAQKSSRHPKMSWTVSLMDTSPEEKSLPFLDYENRLKNCNILKKWMSLIKEFWGLHPKDDTKMQKKFKEKIVVDWLNLDQPCFVCYKTIQRQAHSLIDHKDLNFVQFSNCPNFYYEWPHSSSEHMRGEQYTCAKCGQIWQDTAQQLLLLYTT